jgi:hypothetical protein
MKNIWFIRTDKDDWSADFDISEKNESIYSAHGSCKRNHIIDKHKKKILPSLSLSAIQLAELIREIKKELIAEELLEDTEKKRCDVFITYWISTMSIGDIVFVRNKKQELYICKISGYISNYFFDEIGSFKRPVNILQKISQDSISDEILRRTTGRKTIERNANKNIRSLVVEFIKENDLLQ